LGEARRGAIWQDQIASRAVTWVPALPLVAARSTDHALRPCVALRSEIDQTADWDCLLQCHSSSRATPSTTASLGGSTVSKRLRRASISPATTIGLSSCAWHKHPVFIRSSFRYHSFLDPHSHIISNYLEPSRTISNHLEPSRSALGRMTHIRISSGSDPWSSLDPR
jgi:hypothetical protein